MEVYSKQSLPDSSGVTIPRDGVFCSEIDGAPDKLIFLVQNLFTVVTEQGTMAAGKGILRT